MADQGAQRWLQAHSADLRGQRALVTGATGSLGEAVARALLDMGAGVVLAARNPRKGQALLAALRAAYPAAELDWQPLDLSRLASVDALCEAVAGRVHIVMNCAGVYRQPRKTTEDGLEQTFQINCLAPVYLMLRLLPGLVAARGRAVAMTSLAGFYARLDPADPQALRVRNQTDVYARGKRQLMLAMAALGRLPEARGALVLQAHPGVSATKLFSQENAAFKARTLRFIVPLMKRLFMCPQRAALSAVYACAGPVPAERMVQPRGLLHAWGYPEVAPLPAFCQDEAACRAALERLLARLPQAQREKLPRP